MVHKRVLVVDDEPEVTLALQVFFLGKGYEMTTAMDGLQAMKILRQHPVDLVLLDMKMPGVNGVEVLKFIRAEAPATRVIVVTAYDLQFQEIVEQIGVDGFLMKPFGIQALTQKVEEVLSGRPSGVPLPAAVPAVSEPAVGSGARPRARLLFVEPAEYTYGVKEVFFTDPEKSGGFYEVAGATSIEETLQKLQQFRPDILLVDLSVLGHSSDLPLQVMRSDARPKEMILHGSGSVISPILKVQELSQHGVKVVQNESFTQAGLMRLGDVIRKTALAHHLVQEGAAS